MIKHECDECEKDANWKCKMCGAELCDEDLPFHIRDNPDEFDKYLEEIE